MLVSVIHSIAVWFEKKCNTLQFKIPLVQLKSIWYYRQIFCIEKKRTKWNKTKNEYILHVIYRSAATMKKKLRSKHFLNLWFHISQFRWKKNSIFRLWLRCIFNSSFFMNNCILTTYFAIVYIKNGVIFFTSVLCFVFMNARLSICWKIVIEEFKMKIFRWWKQKKLEKYYNVKKFKCAFASRDIYSLEVEKNYLEKCMSKYQFKTIERIFKHVIKLVQTSTILKNLCRKWKYSCIKSTLMRLTDVLLCFFVCFWLIWIFLIWFDR